MLMLFIAAVSKQKRELCKGYTIKIKSDRNTDFFLDEEAISKLLKAAAKGNIKGQSKAAFNLQQMEQLLENNVWIRDAQLYFDNKAILHISVQEREPVARVFTAGGRSFYLDSTQQILPLSEKALAKIPVFTGFPEKKKYTNEDSALLKDISDAAQYIYNHPFWTSQVAQIDIVSDCGQGCWEFEMVPVVGRHIVRLGTAEDLKQKFHRLFTFYQQVLNKTGFDYYKIIDVRFAGQVVGAKSDNPKVDSVKYMKYVQELMEESQRAAEQDISMNTTTPAQGNAGIVTNSNPEPYETIIRSRPDERRPRAVMSRRR
jgi:cell division protein FtsQ